jgi:uncharacterized protein YceH (UPF0502 family)
MDTTLNDMEVRVLGCLIEKELTTPEYYPLSLNALTNACNQKSNRDPVMALEEDEIVRALDSLRFKRFARVAGDGGRVAKYRHSLAESLRLDPPALAVLAELLLRGPQTIGELRTRGERMTPLADLAAVEAVLQELMELNPPLALKLPRQAGRKEARYAHFFSGMPEITEDERIPQPEAARSRVAAENERVTRLEEEVATLRSEVAELRQRLEEFAAQFQ